VALDQTAFRGRGDSEPLNSHVFTHEPNSYWTQGLGTFRVRFAVDGTGTTPGQLEFATTGTSGWTSVSDVSGTVQAARSSQFSEGATTLNVLTTPDNFTGGYADEEDGAAGSVTLDSTHTELEYCVTFVSQDVTAGGTVHLRVADLDTYTRTPQVVVGLSARERVRLKIGDTDSTAYKLTNAQVDQCVADWPGNTELAAANAAEAIAALYADGYNFASDGQSFNRRERFNHYTNLAADLRKRGGTYAWPAAA
jgi:hypothetical protein